MQKAAAATQSYELRKPERVINHWHPPARNQGVATYGPTRSRTHTYAVPIISAFNISSTRIKISTGFQGRDRRGIHGRTGRAL